MTAHAIIKRSRTIAERSHALAEGTGSAFDDYDNRWFRHLTVDMLDDAELAPLNREQAAAHLFQLCCDASIDAEIVKSMECDDDPIIVNIRDRVMQRLQRTLRRAEGMVALVLTPITEPTPENRKLERQARCRGRRTHE